MLIAAWLLALVVAFFALAYLNAAGWVWVAAVVAALAVVWRAEWLAPLTLLIIAAVVLLPAMVLNIPALRRTEPDRPASGGSWIGLQHRHDNIVTGVASLALLPAWLSLPVILASLVLAWRREGA